MNPIIANRPSLQAGGRLWAGLAAALVGLALVGCDNVEWGGIEVSLTQPAAERPAADTMADEPDAAPPVELPVGPVLFHGRRLDEAGRAWIQPVLELTSEEELRPVGPAAAPLEGEYAARFDRRYYNPGQQFTLVAGGARVGTFVVHAPVEETGGACREHRAEGHVELLPGAAGLAEFLAWSPGARVDSTDLEGPARPPFRSEMPQMAGILGDRGVRESEVPGRWRLRAPADLEPVLVGAGPRGFAATFMVADSLRQGPPGDSAGMAFVVADYDPSQGYFPLFFDAEWYGRGGKRALRWIDAVDLMADASSEWVLRAYGDSFSWYEVVGVRDGERAVVWSSLRDPRCLGPQ